MIKPYGSNNIIANDFTSVVLIVKEPIKTTIRTIEPCLEKRRKEKQFYSSFFFPTENDFEKIFLK